MSEGLESVKVEQLESELAATRKQLAIITKLALAATEPGGAGHVIRRCLEIIATENNWALGQYWVVRADEDTTFCSDWYFASAVLTELRTSSTERRLSKGIGLPGRVWSNAFPVHVPDVESETGLAFVRKSAAINCGITSAYGFPIKNGPFVTGVFEFFSFDKIKLFDGEHLFYEKLGVYIATLIAQREAEIALRHQESLNSVILNHCDPFIAINEASLILQWTSKATELFGWEKDEVIGKPLMEIIIPERYRDAHIRGIFKYMRTNKGPVLNRKVRAPALHKNGHEIPVELLIFPIESFDIKRFGAFISEVSQPQEPPEICLE